MKTPVPDLHLSSTTEDAFKTLATFIGDLAGECSAQRGQFTIALSGGSTPRGLYQLLASPAFAGRLDWDRWHIFWSDERCVPPDHQDSNYRMAKEVFLDQISVSDEHIHRMQGEVVPQKAAEEYEILVQEIFQSSAPSFDLVLLGIGEDGHTASLFPGTMALTVKDKLVVDNWVPVLQSHRITFTLPLINSARIVAFLDTNESKADILQRVLEPDEEDGLLPAALVQPSPGAVHWFLTRNAARLLKRFEV